MINKNQKKKRNKCHRTRKVNVVELVSLSFTLRFKFGLPLWTSPLLKQTAMQRCLIPKWKEILNLIACSFLMQKIEAGGRTAICNPKTV